MPKKKEVNEYVEEHALSRKDKQQLWREFFTTAEIDEFDKLRTPDGEIQHPDINSPLWKAVRKRRIKERNKSRNIKLTDAQVRMKFARFGRQKDAPSPTSFLKAEYQEKEKTKDYQKMVTKVKEKINKTFGTSYYRMLQKNPRYKPVRRPLPVVHPSRRSVARSNKRRGKGI